MIIKFFAPFILILLLATTSFAGFSNYNSILIGERAAGMGGAYTALSNDPSGCSFYNPASLARMEGSALSAAVSVYNKFDTDYNQTRSFSGAPERVNRGAFIPIPTSSGSVYTFRNFAFGLSIVFPDFDYFSGEVTSSPGQVTIMNLRDESLWVGGTIALNLNEQDAIGLTMYYTSRNYVRSITDRIEGTPTIINNEEKSFTNNSIIYILGYYKQVTPNWSIGLSHRFSSLEVSGEGSYFRSEVTTTPSSSLINLSDIASDTIVPAKTTFGIAYEQKKKLTLSFDVSYYDKESYYDLEDDQAGLAIYHRPTLNFNLGSEYFIKSWLGLRFGLYTNTSSHNKITDDLGVEQPSHVDMWGFSTNLAIYTSNNSSLTLGGYYTGGSGEATNLISQSFRKTPKDQQVFTLLVGTSFQF